MLSSRRQAPPPEAVALSDAESFLGFDVVVVPATPSALAGALVVEGASLLSVAGVETELVDDVRESVL
jgi:UDP-N-acetylglucosamine enolpyruvyl transferase